MRYHLTKRNVKSKYYDPNIYENEFSSIKNSLKKRDQKILSKLPQKNIKPFN